MDVRPTKVRRARAMGTNHSKEICCARTGAGRYVRPAVADHRYTRLGRGGLGVPMRSRGRASPC
jgi:hypothetical protein